MLFSINNKPIPGIETPLSSNNIACLDELITLNPLFCVVTNKQKHEVLSLDESSNNTILLADNIQDFTIMLAQALVMLLEIILAPALATLASSLALTLTGSASALVPA